MFVSSVAGIPAEKLVEAHGTFATATCTICRHKVEGSEIKVKYLCFTAQVTRLYSSKSLKDAINLNIVKKEVQNLLMFCLTTTHT